MWQPRGKRGTINVKTNSGRKRINILGALNISDISIISIITEEKCNAERVVELWIKIKEKYPHKNIIIVLDNAKYNHANYTTTIAKLLGINLFFLPAYSPNLNLVERIWKFTKKKLVHNKYYEKFDLFVNEVKKYFESLDNYKQELTTLLTKKFEIIELVQYISNITVESLKTHFKQNAQFVDYDICLVPTIIEEDTKYFISNFQDKLLSNPYLLFSSDKVAEQSINILWDYICMRLAEATRSSNDVSV